MANNIFEQFEEAYSCWSILDNVGKEIPESKDEG